jgi:RNA polymerase sigma-70 factor (ECF subfamily)
MTESDSRIVEALSRGDERAFARLVAEHHASFVRIARVWVHDTSAAEEVVQDAWLAALESLERFEGRSSLRTWLYGIMVNVARTHARARRRMVPVSSLATEELETETADPEAHLFLPEGHRWAGHFAAMPAPFPTPEQSLERAELMKLLDEALSQLPPLQQQVMVLFDVQRFTGEEVCNILGISDTNQRVLLHRARARVRTILEQKLARTGSES